MPCKCVICPVGIAPRRNDLCMLATADLGIAGQVSWLKTIGQVRIRAFDLQILLGYVRVPVLLACTWCINPR